MRLFLVAAFFTNAFAITFAQSPLPQFEIATVKSPGPQDVDVPAWIDSERFMIEAKPRRRRS